MACMIKKKIIQNVVFKFFDRDLVTYSAKSLNQDPDSAIRIVTIEKECQGYICPPNQQHIFT
jgi:hypothetical protein